MHISAIKPLPSDALIAAGLVLEQLGPKAPVSEVVVNGERIADIAAARAAFAEASAVPTTPKDRNVFDKLAEKLANKMDKFEDRLEKSPVGRKLRDIIMADPERVLHRVNVEVKLDSGRVIKKDVDVLDRDATHFLQATSAIAELASMIPVPLIGSVFTGATAVAAAIGALVTRAMGKRDLSRALASTAGKHTALAAVGWIPFASSAVLGFAAVVDHADVLDNRTAPPASLVAALDTAKPATGAVPLPQPA